MKKSNIQIIVGVIVVVAVIAVVAFTQMSQNLGPKVSGNVTESFTPSANAIQK